MQACMILDRDRFVGRLSSLSDAIFTIREVSLENKIGTSEAENEG